MPESGLQVRLLKTDEKTMSRDESSGNEPKKTIFILKSKVDSLRNAENFLRSRDWEISTALTMRDAISIMITKQPEYALIPADHPNKKVRSLPRILAQALPIKIITYCETQNTAAINAMQEMGIEYQIFPPISGPAIERTILKLQRDEKKREEDAARNFERRASDPSSFNSSLPGNSHSNLNGSDPLNSIQSHQKNPSTALSALQQMMSGGSDESEGSDGSFAFSQSTPEAKGRPSGIAYMPGQNNSVIGGQNQNGGPAYSPHASPLDESQREGETFAEWEERIARQRSASFIPPSKNESDEANRFGQHQFNPQGSAQLPHQDQSSQQNADLAYLQNQKAESSGISGFIPQEDHHNIIKPAGSLSDAELKEALGSRKANSTKQSVSYDTTVAGRRANRLNMDSIIVKGTQEALDSAVQKKIDKDPVEILENSSNSLCITVESPRFSGYLVAALGKNRQFDSNFIETIRSRLFEYLKRQGEDPGQENSLDLKLKQVEFEDWALEHAEFLRKSIHNGDEVAMAFFPTQKVAPDIKESAREDMVSININDLQGDVAVLFDVYVYLPANNKYILYTPQGGTFLSDQKDRMMKRGITHMHMKKDQVNAAKKYTAQNFLNDKIDQYHAELESKSKKDPKAS